MSTSNKFWTFMACEMLSTEHERCLQVVQTLTCLALKLRSEGHSQETITEELYLCYWKMEVSGSTKKSYEDWRKAND